MDVASLLTWALVLPVVGGSVFSVLSMLAVLRYVRRARPRFDMPGPWPAVTLLKPVCGLEVDLAARLRTACLQDYPKYQVLFMVQNPRDPVVPILRELEDEFGPERVTVVVHQVEYGPNGKVNNLLGGLPAARHDVLVISDSDIVLRPDYLKAMVAPLADPAVGGVTSLFRAIGARRWYERLELLMLNADFMPSVIFAEVTGASDFCLGPSVAVRRSTLERIGGFEALSEYLAEDYELGRRIRAAGERMDVVPYVVDAVLDMASWRDAWNHQVYWDQNTRLASPAGFFGTILIKAVPFAILFAAARLFDPLGLAVLAGAVAFRIITSWATLRFGIRDDEAIRNLAWLPLRDCVGLATWAMAFGQRKSIWRGTEYALKPDGRMVAVRRPI